MIEVGIALVVAAALVVSAVECFARQQIPGLVALGVLVIATAMCAVLSPASAAPIVVTVLLGVATIAWWASPMGSRSWSLPPHTSMRQVAGSAVVSWILASLLGFGLHSVLTFTLVASPFRTSGIWPVALLGLLGVVVCGGGSMLVFIRESSSEQQRTANLARKHTRAKQQAQRVAARKKAQDERRAEQARRRGDG